MVRFIAEKYLKKNIAERYAYGKACGVLGILLNVLLAVSKIIAGFAAHSLAVMADGLNNFTDVLSSLISFLGFRFAEKKPDKVHPFGHGRYEYIAGIAVNAVICVFAAALIRSAILKIRRPSFTDWDFLTLGILALSLAVKWYIYRYNHKYAEIYHSETLEACAADARFDILMTTGLMVTMGAERIFALPADGWVSLLIGGYVLYEGIHGFVTSVNPLLGVSPDEKFVEKVTEIVTKHEGILGMHDLSVHDYGPGNLIISLHAEVNAKESLMTVHKWVDEIERELKEQLDAEATIHVDPVQADDPAFLFAANVLSEYLEKHYPECRMHDLHVAESNNGTSVSFDLVIPYDYRVPDETVSEDVRARLEKENIHAQITVDKAEYR